jgi:hypothetical protein
VGYTTEFSGRIEITPALNAEEINYLKKFAGTRRMDCEQGPYYADRGGMAGQDYNDPLVKNYNSPPEGQPGLWCQWVPTEDGSAIEWDGGEKFYYAPEWMEYLIEHFVGADPQAKAVLPFLQAHKLNGEITAQGEDIHDRWLLIVADNVVTIESLR